jgi:hypothetical protein
MRILNDLSAFSYFIVLILIYDNYNKIIQVDSLTIDGEIIL